MSLVFSSLVGRFKSMMTFTDFSNAMYKVFIKHKGKNFKRIFLGVILEEDEESYEELFPSFLEKIIEDL